MKTLSAIALVVSLAACSPSDQVADSGGKVLCSNTGECIHADFYAACFHSGALIPVQLDGGMLAPAPISAPPPDGGGRNVAAFPQSLLFTNATTLWLADTLNAQIDVLNVAVWPPQVLGSIATGQSPNQLVSCDGLVISINSVDNTVQGIDPMARLTTNEVNVGNNQNPYLGACDGQHTFYVSDSIGGNAKAIDLSTFKVTGTFTIPQQAIVADPDGGPVMAYPEGVAFYPNDAGGEVFITVASLDTNYNPTGQGNVVATDGLLLQQLAVIGSGAGCVNPAFLMSSPDGTQILESCGGSYSNPLPSEIARIRPADLSTLSAFKVPFSNPTRMATLKNGLVAVTDSATAGVAVINPADGGLEGVFFPCPPATDGGPGEFVADVTAGP
jgi:hypothetical protein